MSDDLQPLKVLARRLYPSAEEAAITALTESLPQSKYNEVAGFVVRKGGGYYYTEPKVSKSDYDAEVTFTIPAGEELSALYHTHTGRHLRSDDFSDLDRQVAQQLGVPSYLASARSGNVYVLDPKQSRRAQRLMRIARELMREKPEHSEQ